MHNLIAAADAGVLFAATVPDKYGGTRSIQFVNACHLDDPAAGMRLRYLRKKKSLSRGALAARLNCAPEAIRQAELRPWDTSIGFLARIVDALGHDLYELCDSTPVRHGMEESA